MATPPKKTPPKSPRRKRRVSKWRVFLVTFGSAFTLACIALLIYALYAVAGTPDWHPDTLTNQKQTSFIYDMGEKQIAELHATEDRQMVASSEIPDLVKKTFVAVEDKRFYDHFGVDPIRIVGSLIADIKSQSFREGASTITMQLANNAFIENPREKTLVRKIQQAALAIQLEREYTKDEILTFYLNRIFFGESSFGIQAAAKTYFGHELSELTPDEIALLARLPQAPSAYNPYYHPETAKERRNIVLGVMKAAGLITPEEYTQYLEAPFTHVENVKANRAESEKPTFSGADYAYPYFVDHVIEELINEHGLNEDQIYNGGLRIYTTVDTKIQAAAEKEFANAKNFPQSVDETPVQGAMTVLDPSTGAIRALVGGRDHSTARGLNRATQAYRQPGSTVKPLVVYAPAMEKGGFFPGTVLDDMPVKYNAGNGKVWAPTNYDTEYAGWRGLISMRFAVQNSVNIYAVKLMNIIGVEYSWNFGKNNLGLPLEENDKVLSLALGTNHVSTLDMASAYGVFAYNGVRATPHAIVKVLDSSGKEIITPTIKVERTMKETSAYLMNSMLRSVVTSGTGTRAQVGNWAVAGKTGTTSLDPDIYGYRTGNPDAWFAGYTPNYVGVVWMGYDKDDETLTHYLRQVYGGGFPAQIWKNVMTVAHDGLTVQTEFKRPAGIVSGSYDTKSGLLPSSLTPKDFVRTEIAAQGNFPTQVSDIWVEKEIDKDHPAYLAGTGTVNKEKKVFLNITGRDPETPWPSDEKPFQMPKEEYNATPPPTETTTPPLGDAGIPVPIPGIVVYDASQQTAMLPVTYPAGSEGHTLTIYVKFPDQDFIQTYSTQHEISEEIRIPLSVDGESPSPGEYRFWVSLVNSEGVAGNPSEGASLSITD
ncbi:PBP1A family penicillin-binding protein [Desulfitobacterium sp. THU1]|uniref:transglycosylase domain-containing protein n=1 Tax=Desulfitobacterium sp. THU1 TaxID=3138072 RepID=UPI00311E8F81